MARKVRFVSEPLNVCIVESDIDTMEIALRRRMENLISEGDFEGADKIGDTIRNLDKLAVCEPEDEEL